MLPESNYTEQLFVAAGNFVARGWSVIPVHGGDQSERAKVAAVPWSLYQHQKPTSTEMHSWFYRKRYGGLAVVTGRISGLVVLDFDQPGIFRQFQETHPDLADTLTVQTRRGFHLYYHLLPALTLPSRKASGVDLQSDGRYVVAPPTIIDGYCYQSAQEQLPKTLTVADTHRIQAFFDGFGTVIPKSPVAPEISPPSAVSGGIETAGEEEPLTQSDLVALYRHLAAKEGRNEALFHTSLTARDSGMSRLALQDYLADVHTKQLTPIKHRHETYEQRHREAIGTIDSAFGRPPRPRRSSASQLPNSVREALMQQGQTATLRVIEGLHLRGVGSGQTLTYPQIVQLLSGIVGQWSIRRALGALTPDGKPIFSPSPRTPTPTNVDTEKQKAPTKKCILVRGSKPTKNQKGRPSHHYFTVPGVYELCDKLGVRRSGSDTITEDDVRAPRRYRQALHREYLRRRPGQYPRSWLASRLGVSISTEKRYNLALPVQVQPRYHEQLIFWSNLNSVPTGIEVDGACLVDETGKRYPARQEIAAHLLAKRHRVIYRRQSTNYYCVGAASDALPSLFNLRSQPSSQITLGDALDQKLRRQVAWSDNPLSTTPELPPAVVCPNESPVRPTPSAIPLPSHGPHPQQATEPPPTPKPKSKRYYRKPLEVGQLERLANEIHTQTNANPNGGMSLYNARRLVDTFGQKPCEAALKRMLWLRRRNTEIRNAAGFMVIASRMIWRVQQGRTDLGTTAPRFRGEPSRKPRKRRDGP